MSRRPRRKIIFDIGEPEGLITTRGMTGDLARDTRNQNQKLWSQHYCLHARRVVMGQEHVHCQAPGCMVDDPDMIAIDHVDNDGKADRMTFGKTYSFHLAILTGDRGREGLQILCANHNQKKNAQYSGSHGRSGRPRIVSDEDIRMTLGLTAAVAAQKFGVTAQTIYLRRKELIDLPLGDMVD